MGALWILFAVYALGFASLAIVAGTVLRKEFEAGKIDGYLVFASLLIIALWPLTIWFVIGLALGAKRIKDTPND